MCNGSVFKSHPIFQQDRKVLQVIAYFDESELCNPLGSNVKKNKMLGIFFFLGNIVRNFVPH